MRNYRSELRLITEVLLRPEDRYDELTKAIESLNQLFLETSGLQNDLAPNREALFLPHGKAIGPTWAGMCVKDLMRTKRFLGGVYLGIRSALARFPARPIRVLYAGTGPFATLALPLTTVFSSAEVRFTMLEINPASVNCLKRVIAAFDAWDFVTEIICVDATRYRDDPDQPFQMIVSETMQNALQKEPQVAITLNLVPQMAGAGILIPENIEVEAVLLNPRLSQQRMLTGIAGDYYHSLGKIFELNKETARAYARSVDLNSAGSFFDEVELAIPARRAPGYTQLCLFTAIRVFGTVELTPWQSSLTMPKQIMNLNHAEQPVEKISFQYKIDRQPGVEYHCGTSIPAAG